MPCASYSDLLIAQIFFFGNILRKSWEMPSSLFAMKITKWLRGRPIFTRLLKKLEIRSVNWWQSQCYSIKTRFSNLEKTFELRMVSHKIKQINAPLRFTNVVLVCLIKVTNISSEQQKCIYLYRQNYTIINQNRQNHIPLNARSWNDLKRSLEGSLKK